MERIFIRPWSRSWPIVPARAFATACVRLGALDLIRTRIPRFNTGAPAAQPRSTAEEQEEEEEQAGRVFRLPPTRVRFAPKPADIYDSSYQPATTADGLESVGDLRTWWQQPDHWGPELAFRGAFARPDPAADADMLLVVVRRAVVEALTLRDAATASPVAFAAWAVLPWRVGGESDLAAALRVVLDCSAADFRPSLARNRFKRPLNLLVQSTDALPTAVAQPLSSYLSSARARRLARGWDNRWLNIPLDDMELRFAIRQRILQLSGHAIPDAKLRMTVTPGDLHKILAAVKCSTLAQRLLHEQDKPGGLLQLANVQVFDRRLTPIDRDAMAGRWKVIAHELETRGLPVTGHRHIPAGKETDWIWARAKKQHKAPWLAPSSIPQKRAPVKFGSRSVRTFADRRAARRARRR